jgi:hypothetical protein
MSTIVMNVNKIKLGRPAIWTKGDYSYSFNYYVLVYADNGNPKVMGNVIGRGGSGLESLIYEAFPKKEDGFLKACLWRQCELHKQCTETQQGMLAPEFQPRNIYMLLTETATAADIARVHRAMVKKYVKCEAKVEAKAQAQAHVEAQAQAQAHVVPEEPVKEPVMELVKELVKEPVMEPAVMEPAVMEPAVMEPAVMEPADMEPVLVWKFPEALVSDMHPDGTVDGCWKHCIYSPINAGDVIIAYTDDTPIYPVLIADFGLENWRMGVIRKLL